MTDAELNDLANLVHPDHTHAALVGGRLVSVYRGDLMLHLHELKTRYAGRHWQVVLLRGPNAPCVVRENEPAPPTPPRRTYRIEYEFPFAENEPVIERHNLRPDAVWQAMQDLNFNCPEYIRKYRRIVCIEDGRVCGLNAFRPAPERAPARTYRIEWVEQGGSAETFAGCSALPEADVRRHWRQVLQEHPKLAEYARIVGNADGVEYLPGAFPN